MNDLRVTLIQPNIIWEDKKQNINYYELNFLNQLKAGETDLILFPELFLTGFSMQTDLLAEQMDGLTIDWMTQWATKLNCVIGGSVIIKSNGNYYNRFVLVSNNGVEAFYDKRHLFRMGEENNHFSAGKDRVIFDIKGWKLLLQVCYDLRFPVFSRNQLLNGKKEYDAVVYVANWPKVRSTIWSNLLRARAIENQAYAFGVNRVGQDGNRVDHSGDSAVINPWGEVEYQAHNQEGEMRTVELKYSTLNEIAEKFPAHLDSDAFKLL
ncbi:MAG: amidohydrolase [Putridiphycobacter sp.]